MIKKFFWWFDGLGEPKRFITFLAIALPAWACFLLENYFNNLVFTFAGIMYLFVLILSRTKYLSS